MSFGLQLSKDHACPSTLSLPLELPCVHTDHQWSLPLAQCLPCFPSGACSVVDFQNSATALPTQPSSMDGTVIVSHWGYLHSPRPRELTIPKEDNPDVPSTMPT